MLAKTMSHLSWGFGSIHYHSPLFGPKAYINTNKSPRKSGKFGTTFWFTNVELHTTVLSFLLMPIMHIPLLTSHGEHKK